MEVFSPALGRGAFLLGTLIAVLSGLSPALPGASGAPLALFLLGLLVGLLNIPEREPTAFLVAVLTLLTVGVTGLQFGAITAMAQNVLTQFTSFVSAAAIVVAIKQLLLYVKE